MDQSLAMMMEHFFRWSPDTLLGYEAGLRLRDRSLKDTDVTDHELEVVVRKILNAWDSAEWAKYALWYKYLEEVIDRVGNAVSRLDRECVEWIPPQTTHYRVREPWLAVFD